MKHAGTKYIETKRLILRPFIAEDAPAMYANWASDPEVTKFLTWPTHSSVEISRLVLSDWLSHYTRDDYYQWAIVPKELGQPIGSIAVVRIQEQTACLELGYCIGRTWWHQGFTSEALSALIEFFFAQVGANRLEARHDVNNPRSGAVMQKCGMTCKGTLRQADRNNQGICDMRVYAILASDREV